MARDRARTSRADGIARARRRGRARARGVVAAVAARALCAIARARADVEDVTDLSGQNLAAGGDVVVRARVVTDRWLARPRVSARCARGSRGEARVEARDDGRWPDDVANDGVFAAKCSTGGTRAGERVRWRWEVESPERAFAPSSGRARYYGTVLGEKDLRTDTS